MSWHWRPEQRSEWTVIENYGAAEKARGGDGGGIILWILLAVFLGLLGAAAWQRL
jgi:hypothetical protein